MMRGLAELEGATVLGGVGAATASRSRPCRCRCPRCARHDIARLLADSHGIFVSGGYHCAHVLHHRLHLDGTLRASAQIYNDAADIEAFVGALREL